MWSQFPPNLSWYSCVVVSFLLLWFPPNLSCLQNNPLKNNVEQFPQNLSCIHNNPPENNVEDLAGTRFTLFSSRLFSRYSCVVVSVFLLWFPPNLSCLQNNSPENNVEDLAGTGFTLFSSGLFWDWFLLDLRSFCGACFRYKLMYYYFCHMSHLRKIIRFLREIECIEFECNEFVLVLVQIDLIHFEQSICISST